MSTINPRRHAAFLLLFGFAGTAMAQYQTLHIPQALYGKEFQLTLKDSFRQLRPGNQTITSGVNGDFWGPTLFINKGDTVRMDVLNKLNDSTTLHWHGFHLPAVMDGGPHQVIPPNTRWKPYWKITNQAATYWYHPHLHEMTQEHMTKGLGGLIIVRDSVEAALALPRTYGTDDIPLVLSSRRYDASNQFVFTNTAYGDYLLTNGTPNAQYTFPRQMVRLRILNAETERGFILGFSDNRTFYVIGNDGGLLEAPVSLTRLPVFVGERYEILVDLSGLSEGSTLDLKAYNSGQTLGFPGGEPGTDGQFGSLLNNKDFSVLHIIIGAQTAKPILSLPASLVKQNYLSAADATNSRALSITAGQPANNPFRFDNKLFDINYINHTVLKNTTEKWSVTNNNVFGHCFHIHDVQFKIVSRSSGPIGAYESGWKDAFFINRNETVSFVARFSDQADPQHPFMYHCHFGNHEDEGMMGQFVVSEPTQGNGPSTAASKFQIYPNPVGDRLYLNRSEAPDGVYYISIISASGKTVMMLPRPELHQGIDVSHLAPGVYYLHITSENKKQSTVSFIRR
ncbi:MAG: multicopper oxidase domain-containing protein [Bacteroidetes bacterium]|nr:multicopper oxidase domain-containing protein [Bacteroidota bacterium]